MVKSKALLLLLLIAFIIWLVIMVWSLSYRENTDVLRYRDWGKIAFLYGFADTYKPDHLSFGTLPNNQPPGSLYVISMAYNANIQAAKMYLKLFGDTYDNRFFVGSALQNIFLRLPQLFTDLLIGVMIYVLAKKKMNENRAITASGLFLFNPVIIYNSAFWGQMDSINNALLILAIFFLLKQKYFLSLFSFFLSVYIKLSVIFLLPFILLAIYKHIKQIKKLILYLFTSLILITFFTLPVSLSPVNWLLSFFSKESMGEMQNITAFAFNFWWLLFAPQIKTGKPYNLFDFSEIRLLNSPLSQDIYFGLPLQYWAIGLFIAFSIPLLYVSIKKRALLVKKETLILILAVTSVLAFLFLPRMHERYLYPVFPLLAVYYGLTGKHWLVYCLFSLTSFINIYNVWHPMQIPILTYQLLNSQQFQWIISFIIVVTGIYFYITSLKTLYSYDEK